MLPRFESRRVTVTEHRISDVVNQLARDFGNDGRGTHKQILTSGRQATFANRVGAGRKITSFRRAVKATKRAHFKITDRGKKSLAEVHHSIDGEYLSQFANSLQFKERGKVPGTEAFTNVGGTALYR